MYRRESWTIKKAEHWRIDAFELWCWRRPFRVPWTARRSNPSILKEISPKYSLGIFTGKDWCWSQNSNTLAPWCEELTHWKRLWCWEILKAGGKGDDRGWDGWMASPTWWTWVWASSRSRWWTGRTEVLQSMVLKRVRHDWATELNCTVDSWNQKTKEILKIELVQGNKDLALISYAKIQTVDVLRTHTPGTNCSRSKVFARP